jgi:hypothetical protein
MDKKKTPQALGRKKIAVIRSKIQHINEQSTLGFTNKHIYETLDESTRKTVSLHLFITYVSRIRKKLKANEALAPANQTVQAIKKPLLPEPAPVKTTSKKQDLEDILKTPVDLNFYSNLTNKD